MKCRFRKTILTWSNRSQIWQLPTQNVRLCSIWGVRGIFTIQSNTKFMGKGYQTQECSHGLGGWVKGIVFFFISENADWLKAHCKSIVLSGCFYGDCELQHRLSVSLVLFRVHLLTRSPTGRAIRTEASLETISYERMKIFLSRRDIGGEALLVLFKYFECYHGDKCLSFIPAPRES